MNLQCFINAHTAYLLYTTECKQWSGQCDIEHGVTVVTQLTDINNSPTTSCILSIGSWCDTIYADSDVSIQILVLQWGSSHGHWNRIHWIWIPGPDSMWSRVSSTPHTTTRISLLDWQHSTQLRSGSRPCGGKVVFGSGSPICIGSKFKVTCGEPLYVFDYSNMALL